MKTFFAQIQTFLNKFKLYSIVTIFIQLWQFLLNCIVFYLLVRKFCYFITITFGFILCTFALTNCVVGCLIRRILLRISAVRFDSWEAVLWGSEDCATRDWETTPGSGKRWAEDWLLTAKIEGVVSYLLGSRFSRLYFSNFLQNHKFLTQTKIHVSHIFLMASTWTKLEIVIMPG